MVLWFKMGWVPIGKFLTPNKWYDSPFDSDEVFLEMIKYMVIFH